jgi:hypothetical protein
MKHVAQFMMLASVFVIAFINPSALGKPLYYSLFPLLFFWVWVFYQTSYVVSEKKVRKVRKEDFSCSFNCGMVPQVGSGDLRRGRLVVTKEGLDLYTLLEKPEKGVPCERSWHLDIKEIRSFGIGSVLANRPGVIFYLDEGDVRFVHYGAKKEKDAITKALGWDEIPKKPENVTVSDEAASAPSFTEVNKRQGDES